jgi:hypothetical protein
VLKRLVYGREVPAVTVLDLSDCAALPWAEQAGVVFGAPILIESGNTSPSGELKNGIAGLG